LEGGELMNSSKFSNGITFGLVGIIVLLVINAVLSYRNVRQLNEDAG
jgi:CHASE3 domain sensor protein